MTDSATDSCPQIHWEPPWFIGCLADAAGISQYLNGQQPWNLRHQTVDICGPVWGPAHCDSYTNQSSPLRQRWLNTSMSHEKPWIMDHDDAKKSQVFNLFTWPTNGNICNVIPCQWFAIHQLVMVLMNHGLWTSLLNHNQLVKPWLLNTPIWKNKPFNYGYSPAGDGLWTSLLTTAILNGSCVSRPKARPDFGISSWEGRAARDAGDPKLPLFLVLLKHVCGADVNLMIGKYQLFVPINTRW